MKIEEELLLAKKSIKTFLKARKLRYTPERDKIIEWLYLRNDHYTADELYEEMIKEFHLSRATVYNTLEVLVECGLAVKHTFGESANRYERRPFTNTHHHRICLKCGVIKEFTDKRIEQAIVAHKFNAFDIQYHTLYLYGICKKCNEEEKKKTKK